MDKIGEVVCLVIPPSAFLLDDRVFPSLGVLKIVTVLEEHYRVDVLDLSGIADYGEILREYSQTTRPVAIGITATTPQMPAVAKIVAIIRHEQPTVRVILGGAHVTMVNASARREKASGRATVALRQLESLVDVLVAGDGEKAIFVALGPNPPKVVDADDPQSPLFLTSEDLDHLPWPDRSLIDIGSYHYIIDRERALSLVSQLGCPFGCGFCGGRHCPSFRRMRSRSIESILAEMEHLHRAYGVKGFMFFDDELNVNPMFPELLRGIIGLQERLGVEFRLRGFVKSQLFTSSQADLMYQAGFRWILVGFESGSNRMLKNMAKRSTVKENTHCVDIARAHGLRVKALMSIGHPGESPATVQATLDWLLKKELDDFDITSITVYPGTAYYDEAVPEPTRAGVWVYTCYPSGDQLYSQDVNWLESYGGFYKGRPGEYLENISTNFLSSEEVVAWRDRIELEVRAKLGIPYPSAITRSFEHSIGQRGLPSSILRSG